MAAKLREFLHWMTSPLPLAAGCVIAVPGSWIAFGSVSAAYYLIAYGFWLFSMGAGFWLAELHHWAGRR